MSAVIPAERSSSAQRSSGEGRTSTGQIGDHGLPEEASTSLIYGQSLVDGGQQGRLFRGVKRLLGNNESQRLMVFDKPFRLVALITPLLLRIRRAIEAQLPPGISQTPIIDHACIGHPVNFEGSQSDRNRGSPERAVRELRLRAIYPPKFLSGTQCCSAELSPR